MGSYSPYMIGSVGEVLVVEGRKSIPGMGGWDGGRGGGGVEYVSAWAKIVAARAGSSIQMSARLPRFPTMGTLLRG